MKALIVGLLVALITLVALAWLNVPAAEASVGPVSAVDALFAALNASDHEAAVAAFTPVAVATLVRGETYRGQEGIGQLVELLEHPERSYDIVQAHTVGDTVTVVVAVSDRGVRWGEEKITIEVQGGKLHRFDEQAFHLRLR